MSHPSRPRARGQAQRRRRDVRLEAPQPLEERRLLAPVLADFPRIPIFEAADTPTNENLGRITGFEEDTSVTTYPANSATTTVTQLTPISAFGGDMVRIEAGPGGDFGKGVYAISRGGGANLNAVNRPGVIYRVDPVTGKASVFFDLNTVINQLEPGANASNNTVDANGNPTGLVNWYDMTFDAEGYFDGRPSLFVSSSDSSDPVKNQIFRIAPDGTFLGAFAQFSQFSTDTGALAFNPTSVHVPPAEQQSFLRGLSVGGTQSGGLFFDATSYRPGQNVNFSAPPNGVTNAGLGPFTTVGQAALGINYGSGTVAAFTNFGTFDPATGEGQFGFSGVSPAFIQPPADAEDPLAPDFQAFANSAQRRFMDVAFDQYGYFSNGLPISADGQPAPPSVYGGSLFVADLGTGINFTVTPVDPLPTDPVLFPVQGAGQVGVEQGANGIQPIFSNGNSTGGGGLGGRIIRIDRSESDVDDPTPGTVTDFARNFNTSNIQGPQAFAESSLSISFSADGTTLYAADNDGIWQFKTVTSLAGSSTGSVVGLNDLRTLGVPYEGQDSAVAVIDTGVYAPNAAFRGRVAPGRNVITNGPATDDLFPGDASSVGGTGNAYTTADGHGTLLAGIIAQFVPQATIVPVNVFLPFTSLATGTNGQASNVVGTNQAIYDGLKYVADNPFVNDPVRPNKVDRVVVAAMGFGTLDTYDSEGAAFRKNKQVVISFKNQLKRFRSLGITPVAAAGQFGAPPGATGTGGGGTTTGGRNNADNPNLGDVNGISLPAILNEVVSVTGTLSFPFTPDAATLPTDTGTGLNPRPIGPVLLFNNTTAISGDASIDVLANLTAGNLILFSDRILAAANRNVTTDYAAPALNAPTFRKQNANIVGQTAADLATIDLDSNIVYNAGGTSVSAGIVAGSFALVASALDYWADVNAQGVTTDAYLTQPVGARSLNFGKNALKNLTAYNSPDGINGILAWTAVPVNDPNDALSESQPLTQFQSSDYRQYARVDVGNAIAAIEGQIAIQYLLDHGTFDVIDSNKNGLITASEVQTFVDNAATIGLPEAGAMARLLGGTARTSDIDFTTFGEQPDQPDVLQRRFNFFDYAGDGQLNGMVTIDQFRMLAHTLLPLPDQYTIVDRQRASANGFLLDPTARRNFTELQHLSPKYQFVPKSVVARYRNISPNRFGVNRGVSPLQSSPLYAAFDGRPNRGRVAQATDSKTPKPAEDTQKPPASNNGQTTTTPPKTEDTKPTPTQTESTKPTTGQTGTSNPSTPASGSSTGSQDKAAGIIKSIVDQLQAKPASSDPAPASSDPAPAASTSPAAEPAPEAKTLGEATPAGTMGDPAPAADAASDASAAAETTAAPADDNAGGTKIRAAMPLARAQRAAARSAQLKTARSPHENHAGAARAANAKKGTEKKGLFGGIADAFGDLWK